MSGITSAPRAGTAGQRAALFGTALLGLAQLASMAESGGQEPFWVAVADALIGVGVLVLLVPAWRRSRRATATEAVLLVLVGLSALPGVFVSGVPVGVRIAAGLTVALSAACAVVLARMSRPARASAVVS